MSFAKSKKVLHEQNNFLPPPGYYEYSNLPQKPSVHNFSKEHRFYNRIDNLNPGPGSYFNYDKETIKKRLLQQSSIQEPLKPIVTLNKEQPDIKISSIPSIPKKSATRVYEELAPGILILHQQEYQNINVGPGSYEVKDSLIRKKPQGIKIQPQPKKRMLIIDEEPQVKVPTIAQQLRQQKRLLYKQNLIKSSNVNKNDINPSDLCLQTIILRQKLLRGNQVPPPGFYYNQETYSSFKKNQIEKPVELQALGGKQQRFKQTEKQDLGPAAYSIKEQINKKGGYMGKKYKIDIQSFKKIFQPGPGTYQVPVLKVAKQQPKGNYPPIFGSGCKRFLSASKAASQAPGPASYKIDKRKNNKAKYIKIRKDFYESQPIAKPSVDLNNPLALGDVDQKQIHYLSDVKNHKQISNHYFKSKVQRFLSQKGQNMTGPGAYDVNQSGFVAKTFNKAKQGYRGDKSLRFDDTKIRPNIGPGTYY